VVRFFQTPYDRWEREQAVIAELGLNKVDKLTTNPIVPLILGQKRNALPFRRL
jgi:hypothetical protein